MQVQTGIHEYVVLVKRQVGKVGMGEYMRIITIRICCCLRRERDREAEK